MPEYSKEGPLGLAVSAKSRYYPGAYQRFGEILYSRKTMKFSALTHSILLPCACMGLVSMAWAQGYEVTGTEDPSAPEFRVMGFGDISYISKDASNLDGFVVGQAVAHLAASLGNSFSVFGEFSATAKDSEYSFEVERMIVKYDFSDTFKLSAGRYHTPIGYWNSAFHHGAWLQTTTSRPEMIKFGSKLVPIHFVGLLLEGNIPVSNLGLTYKAGYGNGRHANIARSGDAGDSTAIKPGCCSSTPDRKAYTASKSDLVSTTMRSNSRQIQTSRKARFPRTQRGPRNRRKSSSSFCIQNTSRSSIAAILVM